MICEMKERPQIAISGDQAWFYESSWQKEERQVDEDLKKGKGIKTGSKKELFQVLDLDES
jgi:hypothetical protein